jgi:hypothetical protein
MIVTDRFVFLHLHKSGGTFVNELLVRFVASARRMGYHLPRSLVPPQYALLPALGLVRSPWSYYVSWYTFQAQKQQPNELFRILSESGRLDFAGTVRNMLNLGYPDSKLDAVLAALPRGYSGRGLNLPASALERIRASNLGFYSFLYKYMFDGSGLLHVGRLEHLRVDLTQLFSSVGQPLSADMHTYINTARKRNVSEHEDYPDYFDEDLRALVEERDAQIIQRHGYRFGD